ncbi:uncharacterized protein LOC136008640 isoform X2 [Lathamus discolor]|uniref:uncharacterized protein LOC136008640 isoform X2 n=1 Tax=Lathamus discolor TaxID=678569 RepID=UPI0032B87C96
MMTRGHQLLDAASSTDAQGCWGSMPCAWCSCCVPATGHWGWSSSQSLLQVFLLTCIYLPASLLSLLGSGSVLAVTSWRRRCCHIQASPTGCQGWALASAEPQEHHCWVNAQWDREGSRGCRMMPSTQLPTCSQCQAWEGRGCGSSSEPGVMPPASTNAVPCPQLRPLCLLALADLLAAASVLGTATIQVLPAPVFIPAYAACPYGWMLATTFYAISFLMVVVYAFESYRMVHGWRARHMAALQEGSGCLEHLLQELPYVLAWLVPALTLLGQLIARGTSLTDIAPGHLEPIMPQRGNGSHETYSLYCSSCLLLIHRAQDICYEEGRGPGGENHLLLVPAAGAQLLHAPVPQGAAPVPEGRRGATADAGEGRLCRQEPPQWQQSFPLLPAGFPALLGSSLPPHPPLLHQHQTYLGLCPLHCHSPEHLPAGLPAQPGLWVAEAQLLAGGGGQEPLPAAPPGAQGVL